MNYDNINGSSDETFYKQKGVGIFGFGSIIPIDLIHLEVLPSNRGVQDNNYLTSSVFNSNAVTLSSTPTEFSTNPMTNSCQDVPRTSMNTPEPTMNCTTKLRTEQEKASLDGTTVFSSSQNFNKIPAGSGFNNGGSRSVDFKDMNIINSIVMKAELARVALIGLDDNVHDDTDT
jgi:hypothetical protein